LVTVFVLIEQGLHKWTLLVDDSCLVVWTVHNQASKERCSIRRSRLALLCPVLMVQLPRIWAAWQQCQSSAPSLLTRLVQTQLSLNLRLRQAVATYIFCMLSSSYPLDFGSCCWSILCVVLHLGSYFVLTGSVFSLFKSIYASDKHCCWSILCNKSFAG
jgi:dipeptide/tripeptide permease